MIKKRQDFILKKYAQLDNRTKERKMKLKALHACNIYNVVE